MTASLDLPRSLPSAYDLLVARFLLGNLPLKPGVLLFPETRRFLAISLLEAVEILWPGVPFIRPRAGSLTGVLLVGLGT